MDSIDLKILGVIVENARVPHKKLAKKLLVSREVFDYRIRKLEESNVILGYQARLNLRHNSYTQPYLVLLQTTTLQNEEQILRLIKKNEKTLYMERLGGVYNYLLSFFSNKPFELSQYIDFLDESFGESKLSLTVFIILEEIKDSQEALFNEELFSSTLRSFELIEVQFSLGTIDKKILQILLENGTKSSSRIANDVGLSAVAVRNRIKNLEKHGIIVGFRTLIDLFLLGFQLSNIFLKLNANSEGIKKKLRSFIYTHAEIIYAAKLGGEFDYLFSVANRSNKELGEFLTLLSTTFPSLKGLHILPVFETLLHQYKF